MEDILFIANRLLSVSSAQVEQSDFNCIVASSDLHYLSITVSVLWVPVIAVN